MIKSDVGEALERVASFHFPVGLKQLETYAVDIDIAHAYIVQFQLICD